MAHNALDNKSHSDLVNERNLMGTKEYHCNSGDLMGGLGLVVQAALAFLAFTSLIGWYMYNIIIFHSLYRIS